MQKSHCHGGVTGLTILSESQGVFRVGWASNGDPHLWTPLSKHDTVRRSTFNTWSLFQWPSLCFNSTFIKHLPLQLHTPPLAPVTHALSCLTRDHPLLHPAPYSPPPSSPPGDQGGFQHLTRQLAMDSNTKTQWSLASPGRLTETTADRQSRRSVGTSRQSGRVRQRERKSKCCVDYPLKINKVLNLQHKHCFTNILLHLKKSQQNGRRHGWGADPER